MGSAAYVKFFRKTIFLSSGSGSEIIIREGTITE